MYCINCGKETDENTEICPYCGKTTKIFAGGESNNSSKKKKILKILGMISSGFALLALGMAVFAFCMMKSEDKAARETAEICAGIEFVDFHEAEITSAQMNIIDPSNVTELILSGKFDELTSKGTGMEIEKTLSTSRSTVYRSKNTLGTNRNPHPEVERVYFYCTEENEPRYISIDFSADIYSDFFLIYVSTLEDAFDCTLKWYYNGEFYESRNLSKGRKYFCVVGNTKYIRIDVNEDGTFSANYQFNGEAPNKSYDECINEAVPADFPAMESGEMNKVYIMLSGTVTEKYSDGLVSQSTVIETEDGRKFEAVYLPDTDYVSYHTVGDTVTVCGYYANDIEPKNFGISGQYPIILADIVEKK